MKNNHEDYKQNDISSEDTTDEKISTESSEAEEFSIPDEPDKKKRLTKIIVGILIVLFLILLLFSFCSKQGGQISGSLPGYDESISQGIIPGMSKEEVDQILQTAADESMFSFQINSKIEMSSSKGDAKVLIGNPPNNTYDFHVEIFLDETKELLYKSGKIPPNHHVENIKLEKSLSKGTHTATAYFNIYDKSGEKVVGKSAAGLNIIVN